MKRFLARATVTMALGALALGAVVPAQQAGAAAMKNSPYGGTQILPLKGSMVHGAAAIVPTAGGLKVVVSVSGLAPMSKHAEHIHTGVCGSNGAIKYPLANLVADAKGNATSTTVIKVMSVAAMGWYINVHDSKTFAPIACGNVYNPDQVVTLKPTAHSMITGYGLILHNMNGMGMMNKASKNTLVVTYISGSGAGVAHPEHLHTGVCGSNGAIKYPLGNLVADAGGTAVTATMIMGAIPMSGLYLNVHAPSFAVQACGNLGMTSAM